MQVRSDRTRRTPAFKRRSLRASDNRKLYTPAMSLCGPQSLCGRSDAQKSLLGIETQTLNLKADILDYVSQTFGERYTSVHENQKWGELCNSYVGLLGCAAS